MSSKHTRQKEKENNSNTSENNTTSMELDSSSSSSSESSSSSSSSSSSLTSNPTDITSLLTSLLADRQQTQQQMLFIQQELLESRKQQTEMIKQLGEFQQKQTNQQQSISEKELARTAAGIPPYFRGIPNDMAVYRWCVAMDRWFETAKIESEVEKLSIAASGLKEAAQTWWELEKNSDRRGEYTTWKIFSEAIKKKYLPMEPDRWVREQLEILQAGNNVNIIDYTNRFNELIQLLPGRNELDKVMEYERGLPQQYRIESRKKNYKQLETAISAAVATYNAYRSINSAGRSSPSIHQMEEGERESASPTSSSSSLSSGMPEGFIRQFSPTIIASGPPPQQVSSLEERVDKLTAMMTQQMNRGGFGGNNPSWNGGEWNNNNNNNSRSRSRSRSRSPNRLEIPKETYEARKKGKQCFRCGQEGHFIKGCRNKANQSN
jgi:hypothetical protein